MTPPGWKLYGVERGEERRKKEEEVRRRRRRREGRGASEGDETESALASEDSWGRRKKNSSCACKLGTLFSFISLSPPSTRLELDVFSAPSAKRGEIVEEIEAKEAEAERGILNARERERAGGMRRKRKKGEASQKAMPPPSLCFVLFRRLNPSSNRRGS
jgi:hypothetical protein